MKYFIIILFSIQFVFSQKNIDKKKYDSIRTHYLTIAKENEVWEPEPDVVKPVIKGSPPSDAIILFDGSDLSKWNQTVHISKKSHKKSQRKTSKVFRMRSVIAIDKSADNIFNRGDGACVREYNLKQMAYSNSMPFPEVQFLVGDISKSLSTSEAYSGLFQQPSPYSDYEMSNFENSEVLQQANFRMISCNFAIHYVIERIDIVFDNVNQLLVPGGYFIGTFLNGEKVFNLFQEEIKKMPKEEKITIENEMNVNRTTSDGKSLWSIQKPKEPWTEKRLQENILSVTIELPTLRSHEQLISADAKNDFSFLHKFIQNKYEIIRLTSRNTAELDFESLYKRYNPKKQQMPDELKEFSFLNDYFILKKPNPASSKRRKKSKAPSTNS